MKILTRSGDKNSIRVKGKSSVNYKSIIRISGILLIVLMFSSGAAFQVDAYETDTKTKLAIIDLLDDANSALGRQDFKTAGSAAEKILELDPENEVAAKLLEKSRELAGEIKEGSSLRKSSSSYADAEEPKRGTEISVKTRELAPGKEASRAVSSMKKSPSVGKSPTKTSGTETMKRGTEISVQDKKPVPGKTTENITDKSETRKSSFGTRLKNLFGIKDKRPSGKEVTGTPVKANEGIVVRSEKKEQIASKPEKETMVSSVKDDDEKMTSSNSDGVFNRMAGLFRTREEREAVKEKSVEMPGETVTKTPDKDLSISKTVSKEKTSMKKDMKGLNVSNKVYKYDMVKKKSEKESQKFLDLAKKLHEKQQYDEARFFAKEAQKKNDGNEETKELIREIDKDEIFFNRQQSEQETEKYMEESSKKAEEDIVSDNAPPKSWMEKLTEPFAKKTYKLGDVEEDKAYSIDECVSLALSRSPRIKVASSQIKLAKMRVDKARRELLPQINLKWEGSSGRIGANSVVRHYRGYKYHMEVKHTVFDGFEKWYAVRQAEVNLENVELELKKIENEIIEAAKKAYYNLDKTAKALKIQEQLKNGVDKYNEIVGKMHEEDIVPEVDYLRVKAQDMQVQFEYMSAVEDLSLAELILYQALSLDTDQEIKIKPVEKPGKLLSIGLKNCYQLALANAPEFRMKWTVLEYYNYDRKMVRAKAWPKVEFNGNFGWSYENYEPLFDSSDYTADRSGPARSGRGLEPEWYAGIKTSVPFWGSTLEHNYVKEQWAPTVSAFRGTQSSTNYLTFKILDKFDYFSEFEETLVGYDRAKYEYEKAKQDVIIAVKEWYFKYRKAKIQMDIANAQYTHQKKMVEVTEQKMKFGEVETSKLVDEMVKLSEHEFGIVQADTDYYLAIVGLNKAIGLSEYFKPEYENEEYKLWKQNTAAK